MKNFIIVLGLLLTIISCTQKSDKDYELLILGDWKYLREIPKYDPNDSLLPPPPPPLRNSLLGYQFRENGIYDYKLGFFSEVFDKAKNKSQRIYLGTTSKYKITNDSLSLYSESDKSWSSYKILSLKKDTMVLGNGEDISKFIKSNNEKNTDRSFDKIIVSSSGCYGRCPVSDIEIDNNGTVFYRGSYYSNEKGYFKAFTSKEEYFKIEKNFQKANWFNLKNEYIAGHTDDETITVTFIKNNKIIKTIEDYGEEAPTEFQWAYIPLRFLHDQVKLSRIADKEHLMDVDQIVFLEGNTIFYLAKSEGFYLKKLLLNSKQVSENYVPKYKIEYWVNDMKKTAVSDGRFYTFKLKDNKEVTLDLGFNFLKENVFLNEFRIKNDLYD